jgi:transglutaminase superfamily protein
MRQGVAMQPTERDFYLSQSIHSDPGELGDTELLTGLDSDPGELARLVRHVLIHREETERFGCVLSESRYRAEAETRYIADILQRAAELDSAPLHRPRAPQNRFAGTCRDFALLHCTLLRRTGTPARIRCGYADYFAPGFHDDHWVTEYWAPVRGWTLVDPQLVPDADISDAYTPDFDPFNVPRDRFLVAGDAWRACRHGDADPETFGVSVLGLTGLWMVRANVVRDLAALNKDEVLPWDGWGIADADDPSPEQLALLDRAAALTAHGSFDELRALYQETPGLRVPRTVTSHTPYLGEQQVTLRGTSTGDETTD